VLYHPAYGRIALELKIKVMIELYSGKKTGSGRTALGLKKGISTNISCIERGKS